MSVLNRETVTPSVVPTSFSPAPEKFARQLSQELRNAQARLARGYCIRQVDYLKNQLHKAPYHRDGAWQSKSDAALVAAIKVAETARTKMLDTIPAWAGSLDESELQAALPTIWNEYVQLVRGDDGPEASDEEPAPVAVVNRPVVPEDAPRSAVPKPPQVSLAEVLTKVEKKSRAKRAKA